MLARELTWSDLRLLGSTGAASSTRAATVATAPTTTALSLTATAPAATATAAVASSLTTLVALDLVEAIVGVRGGARRTLNDLLADVIPAASTGCSDISHLGMVISPRLGVVGSGRGCLQSSLGLGRILGHLNPLLSDRTVVAVVPVALGYRVGSIVRDLDVRDTVGYLFEGLGGRRRDVTCSDLSARRIGHSRVGSRLLASLGRSSLGVRRLVLLCEALHLSIYTNVSNRSRVT